MSVAIVGGWVLSWEITGHARHVVGHYRSVASYYFIFSFWKTAVGAARLCLSITTVPGLASCSGGSLFDKEVDVLHASEIHANEGALELREEGMRRPFLSYAEIGMTKWNGVPALAPGTFQLWLLTTSPHARCRLTMNILIRPKQMHEL